MTLNLKISDTHRKLLRSKIIYAGFFLLAILSLVHWIIVEHASAYQGPGLDMVSYWKHLHNSSYLRNDFLTNSYQLNSPRHLFSNLIEFTSFLFGGSDWYTGFYFWKVLFVLMIPISWVSLLCTCVKLSMRNSKLLPIRTLSLIFVLVLLMVFDHPPFVSLERLSIRGYFSVAWWPPSNNYTHPQTLSLLLGIFGAILSAERRVKYHTNIFLIAATLFHPSVALIGYIFTAVTEFVYQKKDRLKRTTHLVFEIVIGFILPCIALVIIYHSELPLNSEMFRYVYVLQAHPSHYFPPEYGSLGGRGSKFAIALVSFCLILLGLTALKLQFKRVACIAGCFLSLYLTFISMQWIAMYIIPLKPLVQFGPIRLSMLGYWFVAVTLVVFVNQIIIDKTKFGVRVVSDYSSCFKIALLASIIVAAFVTNFKIDQPQTKLDKSYQGLSEWVSLKTPIEAIFAAPFGGLEVLLTRELGRAVYGGAGFPFVEEKMIEFCVRDQLLFGTPEERNYLGGSWVGEKMTKVYQNRLPSDFAYMAKMAPLDYVIRESKETSLEWQALTPVYQDETFKVFTLVDIRRLYKPSASEAILDSPCIKLYKPRVH